MNEFTAKYESSVKVPYAELGSEDKDSPDIWGNAVFEGRRLNIYNDPQFIKKMFTDNISQAVSQKDRPIALADFGGSEGFVADMVSKQLSEQGYRVTPYNIDSNRAALNSMAVKHPDIKGVEASLLEIPLKTDSIDVGILRFVMPYLNQEEQEQLLKNIFTALKQHGRLLILQNGAKSRTEGELFDQFAAEVTAALKGEDLQTVKEHRHFPSIDELADAAKQAGFSGIQSYNLTGDIEWWLSPQAYASRFEINEKQYAGLVGVFQNWKDKQVLQFSEEPDTLRIRSPFYLSILTK